jgi:hypothetical protein
MRIRLFTATLISAICLHCATSPAGAAIVIIDQAKALDGSVTPGDNPGFPVSITRSGSYRLISNLVVPLDRHGIAINASNVTIDFNGFTIDGNDAGLTGVLGMGNPAPAFVTIRNGTIGNFRRDGISSGRGGVWTVRDMQVMENARRGVDLQVGLVNRVLDSTVHSNGLDGIRCGAICHVEGNTVSRNGQSGTGVGIDIESGGVIGNTIMLNRGFGIVMDDAGYGGNMLLFNNVGGVDQVDGTFVSIHPNACNPNTGCPNESP